MSKLARVMAQEEGDNVLGSVPNRDHNPLDLRHSPHSSHAGEGPNDIGIIDNDADGWADAERQLQLYASRGMTLQQMVETLAPPTENNTQQYIDFVCAGMGLPPTATVAEALQQA
jgi:cellulase/cellobiase CelA1